MLHIITVWFYSAHWGQTAVRTDGQMWQHCLWLRKQDQLIQWSTAIMQHWRYTSSSPYPPHYHHSWEEAPGCKLHTLHRGRLKETEIDGGRQSLLAFLKGQLHWVIDIQPDLILISLKKIVQEERKETREEVKKIKWRDVKTGKKHVWRLRRIWWRITARVSGAVTVCVYFGVKQGTRRHEYRLERHSIASHINKGRRSVRSHAVHPSDRTRTHSQKRLQHKQPLWAQTGGKIGHLLIGNVINSPVTNSAIIFISSRLLWVVRRQEAEFDFLLRAPQLQLCVLSHQVFQMLALKALVWVFWYCHQDVNLQRLHMSLQPASLYSPWWLSN